MPNKSKLFLASATVRCGLALSSRPVTLGLVSLVLLATLGGCGKKVDDNQTVGQQVDTAIAASEQAAADAKVKTKNAMAGAGSTLKDMAQQAEVSGRKMAGQAEAKFDDLNITAAVTGDLARDSDLSAFKINVDTKDGVVLLKGTAPTTASKERAAAIAKGAKGVVSVDNQLIVSGS